jgi:hypothetical protein
MDQDIVGGERLASPTEALDAARRDGILPQDLAALDDAPARRFQCGINVLGSGFGFVHGRSYRLPVKAWWSSDLFNAASAASFRW